MPELVDDDSGNETEEQEPEVGERLAPSDEIPTLETRLFGQSPSDWLPSSFSGGRSLNPREFAELLNQISDPMTGNLE